MKNTYHTVSHRFIRYAMMMLWLAITLIGSMNVSLAADLIIQDNVVVKFGQDAGMTVRDTLSLGHGVKFTSINNDDIAGQTKPTVGTPQAGDWGGLKISTNVPVGNLQLDGLALSYAGGNGGAAVSISGQSYVLQNLLIEHSSVGMRIANGGTASLSGMSWLSNQTGLEVTGSAPTISNSEWVGNATAVNNLTPATIVTATGNWWGSASGPQDPVNNPSGAGDPVSTGVDYGSFSVEQLLIACDVYKTNGAYQVNAAQITLSLSCRHAIEVRLSEDNTFPTESFVPITETSSFTLSAGSGNKMVYAQFKGDAGQTVITQLPQAIDYTLNLPAVAFTNPVNGAELTQNTTLTASASHSNGIQKVDFYVDTTLIGSDTSAPYEQLWDMSAVNDGAYTLKAIATATTGETAENTVNITSSQGIGIDITGPTISDIRFDNAPFVADAMLTESGILSLSVSDPSGIGSVTIKIDDQVMPGGNLSASSFSHYLDFVTITNATHTLTIEARDTANNLTSSTLNFSLNIAAPTIAPTITNPANASQISNAAVSVWGTAPLGSQVQLYLNSTAIGGLLPVDSSSNFTGNVILAAEGNWQITAEASNLHGTTSLSSPVDIVFELAAPSISWLSPAAGTTINDPIMAEVSIVAASPLAEVIFKVDGTVIETVTTAPYQFILDTTQYADGPHQLTATATDAAGRVGEQELAINIIKTVPVPPPTYTASVTQVSPAISYGATPITITGSAADLASQQAVSNASLTLLLTTQNNFQRRMNLVTDNAGQYSFNFVPQLTDTGTYQVSVIHPDDDAAPNHGNFTINQLAFAPINNTMNAAVGSPTTFRINLKAVGESSTVSGVTLRAPALAQPSGRLPTGMTLNFPTGVTVSEGDMIPVDITLNSTAATPTSGTVVLQAFASGSGNTVRAQGRLDYRLYTPTPAIVASPSYIETGLAQDQTVTAMLTLENKGGATADNINLTLLNRNGSENIPDWVYLSSVPNLGSIAVGDSQTIQITAAPTGAVSDGIYNFKLRVTSDNAPAGDILVSISVSQSGEGKAQFKVVNLYTETLDENNQPIPGLAGATIKLTNENVPSITATVVSNDQGIALTPDLPPGKYTWRASASKHNDVGGRITIRPGITVEERVFLNYALVTVEFSVTETTIQDVYDINLTATFATQVPAPVVLMEPLSINVPHMQVGEALSGELTLTNYGLVRADEVVFRKPSPNEFFKVEFFGAVPTTLAPKQRIILPYKITQLKLYPDYPATQTSQSPLLSALTARQAVGPPNPSLHDLLLVSKSAMTSGCGGAGSGAGVGYRYVCTAGDTAGGSAGSIFSSNYGSGCSEPGAPKPKLRGDFVLQHGCIEDGGYNCGGGNPQDFYRPIGPSCAPDCASGSCCMSAGGAGGGGPGGAGGPSFY